MLAVSRASATTFAANWIAPSTRQGWGSSFARAMSTNPAGQRFEAGGVPLTRVFSFGSNSVAQLRARVNAQHLDSQAAEVRDWVRIFCMHSTNWGGAVASIVPKPGGMCKSKSVARAHTLLSFGDAVLTVSCQVSFAGSSCRSLMSRCNSSTTSSAATAELR